MNSPVTETRRIEKLRRDHPVESFDCGREELNRYLIRYAWQNQQAGAAQSYVGMAGEVIAGYYTLAVGQVTFENAPERLNKASCAIMLLARLAVDHRWQGQGVGKALLRDAMQRTKRIGNGGRKKRGASTNISILSPPLQTRCTSSFCLRTCGGLSRNQDLHKTLNQHFAA